mgnify:CR=1 FL=1
MQTEAKIVELDLNQVAKQNLWATILLTIGFVIFNMVLHGNYSLSFHFLDVLYLSALYIVLIILHEAFHLIGFMIFGGVKFHELDYGVNLKLGVAYATTTKPLANHAMKKALLLPFWVTGLVPALFGFYFNSFLLVIVGALLIAGAIGDFIMYKELRKFPKDSLIKDDPKLPRLYVYEK